jgi:hypothetical protein
LPLQLAYKITANFFDLGDNVVRDVFNGIGNKDIPVLLSTSDFSSKIVHLFGNTSHLFLGWVMLILATVQTLDIQLFGSIYLGDFHPWGGDC